MYQVSVNSAKDIDDEISDILSDVKQISKRLGRAGITLIRRRSLTGEQVTRLLELPTIKTILFEDAPWTCTGFAPVT